MRDILLVRLVFAFIGGVIGFGVFSYVIGGIPITEEGRFMQVFITLAFSGFSQMALMSMNNDDVSTVADMIRCSKDKVMEEECNKDER